jgi:hypothetical protein
MKKIILRGRKKMRVFVWVVDAVNFPCGTIDQMRVLTCVWENFLKL